jgi:hypothetical protein
MAKIKFGGYFMKKLFITTFILVIIFPLFSQNTGEQITDYFPIKSRNTWTYTNGTGKLNETVFVQGAMQTDIAVYAFVDQIAGIGQTSTLYGLEDNRIVVLVTENILRQYKENKRPFPIELAPANQNWRQNESDIEYYLFKTMKSSIRYDDKIFDDCILVEKQIYVHNKLSMTRRSYFANGVGLVYVTVQGDDKEETCYQKLIDCNFIDIKSSNINNEISKIKEDLINVQMFFFIKLAENGMANMAGSVTELGTDVQKSIFHALLKVLENDLASMLKMVESGTIAIGAYLNSPVPDFLVTINLGNRPIATAIDKLIKIIVLSNVLNLLPDRLKASIQNKIYTEGTEKAESLLSKLYKVDSSISNDDYINITEPIYREYIDLYLRHGGK